MRHVLAIDLDHAGVGFENAEDAFDQHRLAGAGPADHHNRFAGGDIEIDAAQHLLFTEGFGDAAQPDFGNVVHVPKKISVMT